MSYELRRITREAILAATMLVTAAGGFAAESNVSALADGFANPPISARPGAFWNWLNGNVDRDRIKYDLQQMKEKGMSGGEIWDVAAIRNGEMIPAGPAFLGPESAADIRFALSEGKKLGLRMGMITSSGWNAGGTWVDPDWASKMLLSTMTLVMGPTEFEGKLPYPVVPKDCPVGGDGHPIFSLDVAVLAVPENAGKTIESLDQVIDISDKLDGDGVLRWQAPAGRWRVLRFVCTNTGQILIVPSPNSKGLFIDFLDPDATRRHLQLIMDRLGITPENAAESGLNYLEVDSMELHEGNPWTDKFPSWFAKYRSYELKKWLPVLAGWTIGDKDSSDRFVYDYKKTVSDLLIHSHYETGSAFLAKYGMEFVGEAGGPGPPIWNTCPVDALKALGNVDVPRGEFWIKHRNMFLIKEVASASHIYGKPLVDAESFTTWRRWEDSPFELKLSADRAFTEGLNHLTIHGFAHSPDEAGLPGRTYHAGIDINPNTTWWPFARPFMDYMARCSYLLQQGLPVGDVLWYYGDQAPNFFPAFHDVPEKPRLPGLGPGYEYDVVNSDVILKRLKVENGLYVLPEGTSYKVLAFPTDAAMPLEVMEKIADFVKQGGVVVGKAPGQTPGLFEHEERTEKLRRLVAEMWASGGEDGGAHSYGSGKVYTSATLDAVLEAEGVAPDFVVEDQAAVEHLDFIHRRTDAEDIYFVRNSELKAKSVRADFRVTAKTAELWDPTDGTAHPIKSSAGKPGHTRVDFDLDSGGAAFVVFSDRKASAPEAIEETAAPLMMEQPWSLSFPEGGGAPTSVTLNGLESWTDSEEPGIRYFSGTGEYRTTFTVAKKIAKGQRVFIDLGQVRDVAEVEVNGTRAGIAWKSPYRIEVTGMLRDGSNELVVRVVNQWHNRRVGDALTSASSRITRTNTPLPAADNRTLLESGLMGPVMIVVEE